MSPTPARHFESASQQAHAARFGMWVFLSSELLLFAGLFALYAANRVASPAEFRAFIEHAQKLLGSLNTVVLLLSSTFAACAVRAFERGQRRLCLFSLSGTLILAVAFLAIKLTEYGIHFREGIFPGRVLESSGHAAHASVLFWTLYFVTTGLHALHVFVGLVVLGFVAVAIARDRLARERVYVLENATLYWHLVDVIWIFLWPLYYLA